MQVAPNIKENKFPLNSSIAFHTITIVDAPNNAGTNRTQNSAWPKYRMNLEIQDIKGGTEA
jgi:hypothetical protein